MKIFEDLQVADLGKFFYTLAERSQDVFWMRSADCKKQLYISPAYEKVWGYSCQSVYDNPDLWLEHLVPEDRLRLQYELSNRGQNPKPEDTYILNYRIIHADNTIRWIQDISFPLFDQQKKCFGYAGIAKDITRERERF